MPRWMTARASSPADQRDSGLPESRGNVQARAVTRARTAEGKKARPTWPRGFLIRRPRPAAAAPLAHSPVGTAHRPGNCHVTPVWMLVRPQEDLRPHHFRVWCCPKTADAFEFSVLRSGESNATLRFWPSRSREFAAHRPLKSDDIRSGFEDLKTRNEFMIRCTKTAKSTNEPVRFSRFLYRPVFVTTRNN